MKWESIICWLLLWPGMVLSQNSPSLSIFDYAGSAMVDTLAADTAFCKGGMAKVHGANFKRASGGESWDSTRVFIGGFGGFQAEVIYLNSTSGGMNDTLVFALPDVFQVDTCLALTIVKSTSAGIGFNYSVTDTICLRGDYAEVVYPDTLFCLGDANPLPSILLGPNTSGTFCCPNGAPGFIVLPTGEVPLYPGAVGLDNQFQYQTNHPQCGDTLDFSLDILQLSASVATYNGLSNLTICKSLASNPMADTANLMPPYGWGGFVDPIGGLVLLDSLTGLIDVQNSQVGTHQLHYIPYLPCFDTAVVMVRVNAPTAAQVIYPSIGASQLLCQSAPVAIPAFLSGPQGGLFWSVPSGIAFGQLGEIVPGQSPGGTYDVFYLPPGNCVDTSLVISGLMIDTVATASLGFSTLSRCLGDSLRLDTLGQGTVTLNLGAVNVYSGNPTVVSLSSLGLVGGEVLDLQFVTAGSCPDTAAATISVTARDDPTFSYPNPAYCLGDADPFPVISGLGGGTFRAVTAFNANTLVSSSGQLDLTASGVGQHQIRYVTSGSCPDSSTVSLWIYAAASAQFSYAASTFCVGEADPLPSISGVPGGVFAADSGLVVNDSTGLISIAASLPGTYNVTYTLVGGCNTSFSQTVQILPFDSSSTILFVEREYCREGSDPRPAILGDSSGTFFGSAGVVFSNRDSGMVDLSATGPGGPYLVTLDLDNRCALDPVDSIYILETDNADFSYSTNAICEGEAPLEVVMVETPGGVFSSPSAEVVFADSLGAIDLVGSVAGGPYSILYQTDGPCPAGSFELVTILPKPEGVELRAFPAGTICEGEQVILQAVSGSAVSEYSFFVNGNSVLGAFDLLQLDSLGNGDSISCVLENSAGCLDTLRKVLAISPRPQVQALGYPRTIARRDPLVIQLGAYVDGTTYDWKAVGNGAIEVYPAEGQLELIDRGEVRELALGYSLSSNTDRALIQVAISASAGECLGYQDSLEIEVLPADFPVFVPEFMSPNGDGVNDTWEVHWQSDVDPDDYTLRLYSRAGGLVETLRPIHNQFDGAALPDGVYWWSLLGSDGESVLAGGLTIRRK